MYASALDIEQRLDPKHLAELADEDNDGMPDDDLLEAAIADADALIDTYLCALYETPLESPPAIVRKLSADIAIAGLFARRREAHSPVHSERARDAVDLLRRIAGGELALAGVARTSRAGLDSTTSGVEATFDRDSLGAY